MSLNYVRLHLGDLAKKTSDLTQPQYGCYMLLMTWAYANGGVLPSDSDQLLNIARCRTDQDTKALQMTLQRFWQQHDDGWHNDRVDEELASFEAEEPDREARRQAMRDRQRVTRDARRAMHAALRQAGVACAFTASMAELRKLITQHQLHVTADVTRDVRMTSPVPESNANAIERSASAGSALPRAAPARDPAVEPSVAGTACKVMRQAGVQDVNPGHPQLLQLLAAGVTLDELRFTAAEVAAKGKPQFAYALGVVAGRRKDASSNSLPNAPGSRQLRERQVLATLAPGLLPNAPRPANPLAIDIEALPSEVERNA